MDAAFEESESKVGRILDITERVNDKLVEQTRNVATKQELAKLNEELVEQTKQELAKMNDRMEKEMKGMKEMNEKLEAKMDAKMDAILAAIQALGVPDGTA